MNALTELRQLFTISDDGKQCVFHQQMERSTYTKVADILERLEGKWNKKAGAFVFPFNAKEMIEEVFTTGSIPTRNPNQFHPTPRQQVIDMLESSERLHLNLMFGTSNNNPDLPASERNIRVLEPSIGRLGIANVVKEKYPHVNIIGCEIDEVNVKIAREAGYDVIHGDFLQMPIPETEEERFDAVIMNPPFMGRDFLKHIRHAQKMLKRNGALVSVVPSEWMKSATSETEVAFLDEATRCSSEITTEYDKDTYESTNTTTRIVELMHPEDYKNLVAQNKGYWIHQAVVELENEYAFRVRFDEAGREYKKALLQRELKARRNIHKSPSVVEWMDEVLALLVDDEKAVIAKVDNKHLEARPAEELERLKNEAKESAESSPKARPEKVTVNAAIKAPATNVAASKPAIKQAKITPPKTKATVESPFLVCF